MLLTMTPITGFATIDQGGFYRHWPLGVRSNTKVVKLGFDQGMKGDSGPMIQ